MFTSLAEGVRSAVVSLIKVVLLLVVLFAAIAWARQNPDTAERMFTQVANAVASVVTYASGRVIDWTS